MLALTHLPDTSNVQYGKKAKAIPQQRGQVWQNK